MGAILTRDNEATPDKSYCLKVTNPSFGGNFSFTLLDRPFDVREYPILSFDYRVGPTVKIDLLVKVNGRWHNLHFTGEATDYQNKDVNIANLGPLDGIVADDKWHTVTVDLGRLLRAKTKHTQIEEIIMADWRVGGYMKLDFGQNAAGAAFYLDNFHLIGAGVAAEQPPIVSVDDFDLAQSVNRLGGQSGSYCNPGTRYFETAFLDRTDAPASATNSDGLRNRALRCFFDFTRADAYGGYWTSVKGRDLSSYASLRFRVKPEGPLPPLEAGIRTGSGAEAKVSLTQFLSPPDANGWCEVQIPLRALKGLPDLSAADVVFIGGSHRLGAQKGSVLVDDLRLDREIPTAISDFEGAGPRDFTVGQNGAAALSASPLADPFDEKGANTVMRISYGGTIGRDYGIRGGFSYAYWQWPLHEVDARPFQALRLRIRGEKGGEMPNFYLSDGAKRICLRAKETTALTTAWQEIELPLAFFGTRGVDLSSLHSLQIAFEWQPQSGTIYVDDLRFSGRVRNEISAKEE